MRNFFKTILVSSLLFTLSAGTMTAQNIKPVSWGLLLGAGASTDNTKEYVYSEGYTLSRLDWQQYFNPKIYIQGNANIFHAIIDAEYTTSIPVKAGIIEDWDWLKDDKTKPTNYSKSDLTLNKDYQFKIKAGYEFLLGNFRILPLLGFAYRNRKMEATNGYYQYGSEDSSNGGYWAENLQKNQLYGVVLTYEQQFLMPFITLNTEYHLNKDWSFMLYGTYIPYIKCDAIDFHCATTNKLMQFNDFMKKGYGFNIGTGVTWKNLTVCFEYEYLRAYSGYSTERAHSSSYYGVSASSTTPGTESSSFTLKAVYKMR